MPWAEQSLPRNIRHIPEPRDIDTTHCGKETCALLSSVSSDTTQVLSQVS